MAVLKKYSLGILKKIFGTEGSTIDPDEEKAELIAAGVPWEGYTADDYWEAFKKDGYTSSGPTTTAMNRNKTLVNQSPVYQVFVTSSKEFPYEHPSTGNDAKITLSGWQIIMRKSDVPYWPEAAYLALFTKMPDKDGNGYEEPAAGTNYNRINLHKSLISGNNCITVATADKLNGGTYVENREPFQFMMVDGGSWGTIVGVGVMSNPTPRSGDKPQMWTRLTTPITTQDGRVPLFRLGEFRTTLR